MRLTPNPPFCYCCYCCCKCLKQQLQVVTSIQVWHPDPLLLMLAAAKPLKPAISTRPYNEICYSGRAGPPPGCSRWACAVFQSPTLIG